MVTISFTRWATPFTKRKSSPAPKPGRLESFEARSDAENDDGIDTSTVRPSEMEQQVLEQPLAPGTIFIQNPHFSIRGGNDGLIRRPQPSEDPNDPLNWSKQRKFVNYAIISFYALMTFTILDIGTVAWQDYVDELGMTFNELNITYAANTAGLAFGCIFFIPFALKYGRRPVYIISTIITFGTSVWQAKLKSYGEMVATQVLSGLSGAVSEALVQMTVCDMFFVHQRGTMNGVYLLMVAIGSSLAPVASGLITFSEGWRWMYWWTTILLGINVLLFIFCYEETKFIPKQVMLQLAETANTTRETSQASHGETEKKNETEVSQPPEPPSAEAATPLKTYRQRMAFTTTTAAPLHSLFLHAYQPFMILFTIPAVFYVALQYGTLLAWFSIVVTSEAEYFVLPPYNFTEIGIGLLSVPAFVGCLVGFLWGGPLSDWSILWLARRNKGIYEPEMRLYGSLLPAVMGPVGLFMYGYGTAAGAPWILAFIGVGFFGFSVTALGDITLTYLSDSYSEIIGDALVSVTFIRNALATIVVFAQDPWTDAIGLHGLFTCVCCMAIGVNVLFVPLIIFGKKFRISCAGRYKSFADRQFDPRAV